MAWRRPKKRGSFFLVNGFLRPSRDTLEGVSQCPLLVRNGVVAEHSRDIMDRLFERKWHAKK